jgi:hypothetical protein
MRRKPAWFERSHAELDRSPYGPIGPSTNSKKWSELATRAFTNAVTFFFGK